MTRGQQRLVALSISTLASAAIVFAYFKWKGPADTVVLVDNTEDIVDLLNERQASGSDTGASQGNALVRGVLDPRTAKRVFWAVGSEGYRYDPKLVYRRESDLSAWLAFPEHPDGGWTVRTNAQGMREDSEVMEEAPDLRVLVAGDSHTDGLCANVESFVNVMEEVLSEDRPGEVVEALNAGVGGYSFYNYLGVLERYAELAPDVFVVMVYGGNDFARAMSLQRYFERRGAPSYERISRVRVSELFDEFVGDRRVGLASQVFEQWYYFLNNPDDVDVAVDTAVLAVEEMQRQCSEAGIQLLCVYLPTAFSGQPGFFTEDADRLASVLAGLGADADFAGLSDRMADRWLTELRARQVATLDLRPLFASEPEICYWRTDLHVNVRGHRAIAEALAPLVEGLLD